MANILVKGHFIRKLLSGHTDKADRLLHVDHWTEAVGKNYDDDQRAQ